MKFNNAYSGIKKLLPAEIINIIMVLCYLAAIVIFYSPYFVPSADLDFTYFIMIILSLFSGVIGIAAFILQAVGFYQAKRDDRDFRKSFWFTIFGIVSTLVSFLSSGTFSDICAGFTEAFSLLVSVYAILGIYNIAEKLGDQKVMKRGRLALYFVGAMFAFAVISRAVGFFAENTSMTLDFACSVLDLTGHIIFLTFLCTAKKMLAEACA